MSTMPLFKKFFSNSRHGASVDSNDAMVLPSNPARSSFFGHLRSSTKVSTAPVTPGADPAADRLSIGDASFESARSKSKFAGFFRRGSTASNRSGRSRSGSVCSDMPATLQPGVSMPVISRSPTGVDAPSPLRPNPGAGDTSTLPLRHTASGYVPAVTRPASTLAVTSMTAGVSTSPIKTDGEDRLTPDADLGKSESWTSGSGDALLSKTAVVDPEIADSTLSLVDQWHRKLDLTPSRSASIVSISSGIVPGGRTSPSAASTTTTENGTAADPDHQLGEQPVLESSRCSSNLWMGPGRTVDVGTDAPVGNRSSGGSGVDDGRHPVAPPRRSRMRSDGERSTSMIGQDPPSTPATPSCGPDEPSDDAALFSPLPLFPETNDDSAESFLDAVLSASSSGSSSVPAAATSRSPPPCVADLRSSSSVSGYSTCDDAAPNVPNAEVPLLPFDDRHPPRSTVDCPSTEPSSLDERRLSLGSSSSSSGTGWSIPEVSTRANTGISVFDIPFDCSTSTRPSELDLDLPPDSPPPPPPVDDDDDEEGQLTSDSGVAEVAVSARCLHKQNAIELFSPIDVQLTHSIDSASIALDEVVSRDLTVFHSLHGGVRQSTTLTMDESSTCETIIREVLQREDVRDDWRLYQLASDSTDDDLEIERFNQPLVDDSRRGENGTRFELLRKKDVHVKIVCDTVSGRPKNITLDVAPNATAGDVIKSAVEKFEMSNERPADYSLIQIDKSTKEMKRIKDTHLVADLKKDYFLLCKKENLARRSSLDASLSDLSTIDAVNCSDLLNTPDTSGIYAPFSPGPLSFAANPGRLRVPSCGSLSDRSQSPSVFLWTSAGSTEISSLQRQVHTLERDLAAKERSWNERVSALEMSLERFKQCSFAEDATSKVSLMEQEYQDATRTAQLQEQRVRRAQHHVDRYRESGVVVSDKMAELEKNLADAEKLLADVTRDQSEVFALLETARKIQQQQQEDQEQHQHQQPSGPTSVRQPQVSLYDVVKRSTSRCYVFALVLHPSECSRIGFSRDDTGDLFVVTEAEESSLVLPGDRFVEVDSIAASSLNDDEFSTLLKTTTKSLRTVLLRETSEEPTLLHDICQWMDKLS